jgi:hypothetical protein
LLDQEPVGWSALYFEVGIRGPVRKYYYVGGADKSLTLPIFPFAAQPKEFFFDGLKNLEQRSHKCVELRGEYVE